MSSSWSHGQNFIFQKCDVRKIIIAKVYKLFLKSTTKYLRNDGSILSITHVVQNLWAFPLLPNLLKLRRHLTKNAKIIAEIIPQNQILY